MKAALALLAGLVVLVPMVQSFSLLDIADGDATPAWVVDARKAPSDGHSHAGGVPSLFGDHGAPQVYNEAATNPRRLAGAADYDFNFKCPDPTGSPQTAVGCPQYVLDPEDIMTQPVLVVDPRDPNMIAFHSLHGGAGVHTGLAGDVAPNPTARDDVLHQPHTVFQTTDAGSRWADNRYYSPYKGVQDGNPIPTSEYDQVYGLDNALVLDGTRGLIVGSLYAYRDDGEANFRNVVFLWKSGPINYHFDSYSGGSPIYPVEPDGVIDNLHLSYAKESDRIVAMWRESAAPVAVKPGDARGPLGGPTESWIQFATSPSGTTGNWEKTPREGAIGPCQDVSNPITFKGLVYVACLPDAGFAAPAGFEPRFIQIFAFDPAHGTTAHIAQAPLTAGHPVLAKLEGDKMAVFSAGVVEGEAFVRYAVGEPAVPLWLKLYEIDELHNGNATHGGGAPTVAARVTAVTMSPESHYLHVIYEEQYDRSGTGSQATAYGAPEIYKAMGAIDPQGRWAGGMDLRVGDPVTRVHFDPQYQGVGDSIFWDLHDSFFTVTDKTGETREFVAYGDYGFVRMAEIEESNFAAVAAGFGGGPPAVPTPTPGVNPAAAPLVAGALAGALSLRILAARRKNKVEAPSL